MSPQPVPHGASAFKPVQNTTLAEAIAEQIVALIARGHFKPGDRLPPETTLMKQFGVGRSTLREALKSLGMAGLIETRRSAGTFVNESYSGFLSDRFSWAAMFSERELRDIVEVRYALEGQTAQLAAERATPEQKATLARLVAQLADHAIDPGQATACDLELHVTIAEASHNPLLLNLILNLRHLMRDYIKLGYTDHIQSDGNAAEHRRILEAIQAGQPEAARQAMIEHLGSSAQWMLPLARERRLQK